MIAFDAKQHWQVPYTGDVEGFVKVTFAGAAITCKDKRSLCTAPVFGRECNAIGDAQLWPQVADHTHNVVVHRTKVKAAIVSLCKARSLALKLGKQAG